MKHNKFSLLQYSILASTFIALNKLHAQVVYIDIEPDITLDTYNEYDT